MKRNEETESNLIPMPAVEDEEREDAPLPYALAGHRLKLYAVATVFVVAGIAIAIYLKSFAPLLLVLFSGYFWWQGFNVLRRYRSCLIREVAVLCTSVKPSRIRDAMTLTFRTVGDEANPDQEYFKFLNQPKRTADEFVVNSPYVIYFDTESPQTLLGYIDI